jgi:hypothetical protein
MSRIETWTVETQRSGSSRHAPGSPSPRRFAILLAGVVAVAALSGCAGQSYREEQPQRYPDNYKAELLQFLHSYINDPTNIRSASMAEPVLVSVDTAMERTGVEERPPPRAAGPGGAQGQQQGTESYVIEGTRQRYVVCVRYNAKDRDGRYTGIRQGMAVYSGGRFERFIEPARGVCNQAEYKPFPELEKLGR